MQLSASALRAELRKLSSKSAGVASRAIGEIRRAVVPERYSELIAALRAVAPKHQELQRLSPTNFESLLHNGPIQSLPIERELVWAPSWITPSKSLINRKNELEAKLQHHFVECEFEPMLEHVRSFQSQVGHSFWAAELEYGLLALVSGPQAVLQLHSQRVKSAANRPSSLLSLIFVDRNDPEFSYDRFSAKCNESFPRFREPWLRTYLPYRATSNVADPISDFPTILGLDIASSTLDYYEALVDCVQFIRLEPTMARLHESARRFISAMQALGIEDIRLEKLGGAYTTDAPKEDSTREGALPNSVFQYKQEITHLGPRGGTEDTRVPLVRKFHVEIDSINLNGITAQEEISELLKIGVNFKNIAAGSALAIKAISAGNTFERTPLFPYGFDVVCRPWPIEESLCGEDSEVESRLQSLAAMSNNDHAQEARATLDLLKGTYPQNSTVRPILRLWAARCLMNSGKFGEATAIVQSVRLEPSPWPRHSLKIEIQICAKTGEYPSVFERIFRLVREDFRYAYELPLSPLFQGRKWKEFGEVDFALVGHVAHHANVAYPNANNRFICRMAFRELYKIAANGGFEAIWAARKSVFSKESLIAFLTEAWVDDNLALLEQFKSTQELRQERIRILQFLLAWDERNQQTYASKIQELTLDETLWRGLRQIDETRIFVNEPAITRWAEKELQQDYERWQQLAKGTVQRLPDDLARDYIVDPELEEILKLLPKETNVEANALLLTILDRLYKRFLTDPAFGLDSYLSLRIRHGSFRGTLLGPLEHARVLISGPASERAFRAHWHELFHEDEISGESLVRHVKHFTEEVQRHIKEALESRIQIQTVDKPAGFFIPRFDPARMQTVLPLFDPLSSLSHFLTDAYVFFWGQLSLTREDVAAYVKGELKRNIQSEIDRLVQRVNGASESFQPLIYSLKALGTLTQTQCDVVGNWFLPQEGLVQQSYQIAEAIEIAKRATASMYAKFRGEVIVEKADELQLSASGLSTLCDCLFVTFENAWKHSGLEESLETIHVSAEFRSDDSCLILIVRNALSPGRLADLIRGEFEVLRKKYLVSMQLEMVPREGGSGFPKLARIVGSADRSKTTSPLNFEIDSEREWCVTLAIPLFERAGVFDGI